MHRRFLTAIFAGLGTAVSLVPLAGASPWSNQLIRQDVLTQATKTNALPSDQFVTMSSVLGLNICYSVSKGVDYKKAAEASTSALFSYARDRYGSKIQGAPPNLQGSSQLTGWIALDLLFRTSTICPSKLPSEVVDEAKRLRAKLASPK